jgi:hypothetical protein
LYNHDIGCSASLFLIVAIFLILVFIFFGLIVISLGSAQAKAEYHPAWENLVKKGRKIRKSCDFEFMAKAI